MSDERWVISSEKGWITIERFPEIVVIEAIRIKYFGTYENGFYVATDAVLQFPTATIEEAYGWVRVLDQALKS